MQDNNFNMEIMSLIVQVILLIIGALLGHFLTKTRDCKIRQHLFILDELINFQNILEKCLNNIEFSCSNKTTQRKSVLANQREINRKYDFVKKLIGEFKLINNVNNAFEAHFEELNQVLTGDKFTERNSYKPDQEQIKISKNNILGDVDALKLQVIKQIK